MTTAVMTGQTTTSHSQRRLDSMNPWKHDSTVFTADALKSASDNIKSQFAAASSEKDFEKRVAALTHVSMNASRLEYESMRALKDTKTSKIINAGTSLTILSGGTSVAGGIAAFGGSTGAIGAIAAAAPYLAVVAVVGGVGVGGAYVIQNNFSKEANFRDNANDIHHAAVKQLAVMARSNPVSFDNAFDNAVSKMPETFGYTTPDRWGDMHMHMQQGSNLQFRHQLLGQILNSPKP